MGKTRVSANVNQGGSKKKRQQQQHQQHRPYSTKERSSKQQKSQQQQQQHAEPNMKNKKKRALVIHQAVEEMNNNNNNKTDENQNVDNNKRFKTATTTTTTTTTTTHGGGAAVVQQPSLGVLDVPETCALIAELSEAILENPQGAFVQEELEILNNDNNDDDTNVNQGRKSFSKMGRLLAIAGTFLSASQQQQQSSTTTTDHDEADDADDEHVSHLAILSLLVIFKDILPAYRIRLPTQQEMAIKVSKETKQVWDYERALLQHYQQYLQLLEATWKTTKKRQQQQQQQQPLSSSAVVPSKCAITSILGLADLLKSAFHFTFRSNLLTVVVSCMNHANGTVRNACCEAIQHVFIKDAQGEVALEATRRVTKMIKARNFCNVRPQVLKTLASLPLRVHVDEAQAAKLTAKANAKKRKKNKELAAIESELREGRATVDKIILARSQADSLQAVTLTYFRILKNTQHDLQEKKSSSLLATSKMSNNSNSSSAATIGQSLLPATLEGLAKFAHLINIDTVLDLLKVLQTLLQHVDALPLDASLHAILTAFFALQGPGKELKVDVKEYLVPLYTQVPRIVSAGSGSSSSSSSTSHQSIANTAASTKNTELLLQCLRVAFFQRREFSHVRVAAFLKQILMAAMHTSSTAPATSMALLAFARQILQRYPTATASMLENEVDVIASGQYQGNVMECNDPELANPLTTCAWELSLLKLHVHPEVSRQATHAAANKVSTMPLLETPERFLETWRDHETGKALNVPFVRSTKKHPLAVNSSAAKKKNKKKHPPRFITPRVQKCFLVQDPELLKKNNN